MSELPILIAGGGIGGLASALALAKIGRHVEILERSPGFSTAGAGIQLGPNAVKVLRLLGVAEAVREQACQPPCLAIYSGGNDHSIARMPLGTTIAERCGAPYWTVHRADLLQALADAASHSPLISLSLGCHVSQVVQTATGVTVTLADGSVRQGQALIGADGVWSRVRELIEPSFQPVQSGYCAYRTILPLDQAGDIATDIVAAWLSPSVHVVHYPVQAGSALNIVVVVRDAWNATGWDAPADPAAVLAASADFPQRLRSSIAAAPQWHKWSLPRPIVLTTWTKGPIALLGDAAHAMLPFLAQGGAMALEDAAALAASVANNPDNLPAALNDYQAGRHKRVARVQAASVENGRVFHLSGPMAFARDTVLRVTPAATMLARFDWLYGYEESKA